MTRGGGRRASTRRPVPSRRARDHGSEDDARDGGRRRRPTTTTKTKTKTTKTKTGMVDDDGTHARASSRGRGGGASSFAACTDAPRAFGDGKIGGPTRKSAKGGWTPEEVRAGDLNEWRAIRTTTRGLEGTSLALVSLVRVDS